MPIRGPVVSRNLHSLSLSLGDLSNPCLSWGRLQRIAKTAAEKQAKRLGKGEAGAPGKPKDRKVVVYEDDDGNSWEGLEDVEVPDELSFELNVEDDR